jgi:alkylhydroperoxidase family enzyme
MTFSSALSNPRKRSRSSRLTRSRQFSDTEIAFLASSIAVINAWNRLGAGLGFPPPMG